MQASEIRIRRAAPDDAAAIVRLIRRCYGETYCVPSGVDPARVRAAILEEREVFALAVDPAGEVLGQAALVRRGAGVFECARVVIDQTGRSRGLMQRLTAFLFGDEAQRLGARLLTAGAVTNHLHAQRNGRAFAMTPLGLLLAVYPEFTAMAGFGRAQQPVSTVIYGLWVGGPTRVRRPRLAGADRRRALAALDGLGLVCRPRPPAASAAVGALGCELVRDEAIGLLHLRYGADRPADPSEPLALADPELLGGRLLWADVPLEHPGAQAQIDRLRRAGLGYGAVLPVSGQDGEDVLRLQRVLDPAPLRPEGIEVLDELRALRDDVSTECLRPQLEAIL